MIELAINLETIYPGMDFCDKIRGVHRAGFRAIEFWGWQDKDLPRVKALCKELGVKVQAFSGTGSWSLCDRESRKAYMDWVRQSVRAAKELECSRLILFPNHFTPSGCADFRDRYSHEAMIANVTGTLTRLAPELEQEGMTVLLEPLCNVGADGGMSVTDTSVGADIVRAPDGRPHRAEQFFHFGPGVLTAGADAAEEPSLCLRQQLDCQADGTYTLTQEGQDRFTATIQVPEEYGGGSWSDGNNQINQWIVGSAATNPLTGECYDPSLWASSIEMNMTATTNEWIEQFGAQNEVEYLEGTDQLKMVANINIPLASDSTDIALIRSQCGTLIKDTSWQMVFAKDEAEFNSLWENMCTQLEGLGWGTLTEYDTEKYQAIVDARIAAAE